MPSCRVKQYLLSVPRDQCQAFATYREACLIKFRKRFPKRTTSGSAGCFSPEYPEYLRRSMVDAGCRDVYPQRAKQHTQLTLIQ